MLSKNCKHINGTTYLSVSLPQVIRFLDNREHEKILEFSESSAFNHVFLSLVICEFKRFLRNHKCSPLLLNTEDLEIFLLENEEIIDQKILKDIYNILEQENLNIELVLEEKDPGINLCSLIEKS